MTPAAPLPPEVLTLDEAAAVAGVHPVTLAAHIRAGRLSARNVGTGKRAVYRLLRSEVMAWLAPPVVSETPSASTSAPQQAENDGGTSPSQSRDEKPSGSTIGRTRQKRTGSRASASPPGRSAREILGLRPKRPC